MYVKLYILYKYECICNHKNVWITLYLYVNINIYKTMLCKNVNVCDINVYAINIIYITIILEL